MVEPVGVSLLAMPSPLLTTDVVEELPVELVRRCGVITDVFDHRTQDSGNVSWLVDTQDGNLFVKSAGLPGPAPADAPTPYLDHDGRIALLRNAVALARSSSHPALANLRNVVESPVGPMLVYDQARGELIGTSAERRGDPTSAYQRFAHLEPERQLAVFDQLIEVHAAIAAQGWVAADLYDGCLIVDFSAGRLTLIDLDTYQRGPGTNTMGRMFGSTRFMAPEEHELGAPIDQRTTVFTIGRLVWHFGTQLTELAESFCGGTELSRVIQDACAQNRADRHPTVAKLADRWHAARTAV